MCLAVIAPIEPPLRVVVLADTHLRSDRGRWLPAELVEQLRAADVVLHAGDVLDSGVLGRLASMAPLYAVLGNNDGELAGRLPTRRVVELAGVRVGMVHDSGRSQGRAVRLRRMFPDCSVVVFGHSHAPVDEIGADGQLLFNPGSPTQRRLQPHPSFGELVLGSGEVLAHRLVMLGP